MGYLTNGLSFRTLRATNERRLPEFKNAHGEPAHSERRLALASTSGTDDDWHLHEVSSS